MKIMNPISGEQNKKCSNPESISLLFDCIELLPLKRLYMLLRFLLKKIVYNWYKLVLSWLLAAVMYHDPLTSMDTSYN